MQLARRIIAKSCEEADRFHRGKASHQPAHRTQYALSCAIIAVIGVMRVANEAAVAGAVSVIAGEGSNLAVKLADRGADERHACGEAEIVYQQPCAEIIAAVDNNVDACQDFR